MTELLQGGHRAGLLGAIAVCVAFLRFSVTDCCHNWCSGGMVPSIILTTSSKWGFQGFNGSCTPSTSSKHTYKTPSPFLAQNLKCSQHYSHPGHLTIDHRQECFHKQTAAVGLQGGDLNQRRNNPVSSAAWPMTAARRTLGTENHCPLTQQKNKQSLFSFK